MARALSGSGQYLSRTDPTGIAINAAWTFITNIWMTDTAANQTILLVGTAGATLSHGIVIRHEDLDRIGIDNTAGKLDAAGGMGTGAYHRLVVSQTSGNVVTVSLDGTQLWQLTNDPNTELTTGDVIRFGSDASYSYYADWHGRFAWSAWVQGTAISVANADTYAQNPCNLLTDYGPSGVVTANALKGLWPFQPGSPGQDISGVGNDLTDTSTTDVADPAGYPTSCSTSPTLELEGYRGVNDDGSESTATFAAAQDTGFTLAAGEIKRLRTIINATGDPAAGAYQLEYRKSGEGTWLPVSN